MHPYQAPTGHSQAPPVRQRKKQAISSSVDFPNPLPAVIFRFLDLSKINLALREDKPNLYIIMFSNQSLPFVVSGTHRVKLDEVAPMYRIKTTTTKTPMIGGVPNDYLNPNTSSMKMIAWNCQGASSVTFHNHAYELHRRHRPNILIIIEPRIAKAWAQAVINILPYTHSR